jgi:soluble lytic murein transglycosylase-like protein
MARFTLGLLFAIRLLTPGTAAAQPMSAPEDEPQTLATEAPPPTPPASDVPALITEASQRWGLDTTQMLRVAWCESKFDPAAYNRRSGASGLFQFIPGTWSRASAAVGMGWASPFDAAANVEAAAWLMKTEGPRHWVCR